MKLTTTERRGRREVEQPQVGPEGARLAGASESKDTEDTEGIQHTPGPWIVRGGNVIESLSRINVAKAWMTDGEEECANARLIAAAPDLLVALEQCVPIIVRHANATFGDGVLTLQVARKAISKAKGETT